MSRNPNNKGDPGHSGGHNFSLSIWFGKDRRTRLQIMVCLPLGAAGTILFGLIIRWLLN